MRRFAFSNHCSSTYLPFLLSCLVVLQGQLALAENDSGDSAQTQSSFAGPDEFKNLYQTYDLTLNEFIEGDYGHSYDNVKLLLAMPELNRQPFSGRLYYELAQVSDSVGKLEEAKWLYRKAANYPNERKKALLGLSDLFCRQSKFLEALSVLEELLKSYPEDLEALFVLKLIYQSQGESEAAQEQETLLQDIMTRPYQDPKPGAPNSGT
jgi:tetratricopeptide (TPR) repeat protein